MPFSVHFALPEELKNPFSYYLYFMLIGGSFSFYIYFCDICDTNICDILNHRSTEC